MASKSDSIEVRITPLEKSDYAEWERLFRLYIAFYKSSLPDTQYAKTFARILDPQKDLYGLVLRDVKDPAKLYGLAHYFPTQTPWAEEMLMHFNGTSEKILSTSVSCVYGMRERWLTMGRFVH